MKTFKGYAILAALAIPGLAFAVSESESNNEIGLANALEIVVEAGQPTGGAAVDGAIGITALTGAAVKDVDLFTFSGKAGDTVTLDIDGGAGFAGTVKRNVDTILAVFGPAPGYKVLRQEDDVSPADVGSKSTLDARIINFTLPATGTYVVGVSAFPYDFVDGGTVTCRKNSAGVCQSTKLTNGGYTLLVTGVSPPLLQINIDIKPGNDERAPINPKSRGKIPVALLGASDFIVQEVDVSALTFGHSGNEASLARCGEPSDVNGDAFPDRVCHFENQDANFAPSDSEAILRGKLGDGRKFEGRGWLKMVPVKAGE